MNAECLAEQRKRFMYKARSISKSLENHYCMSGWAELFAFKKKGLLKGSNSQRVWICPQQWRTTVWVSGHSSKVFGQLYSIFLVWKWTVRVLLARCRSWHATVALLTRVVLLLCANVFFFLRRWSQMHRIYCHLSPSEDKQSSFLCSLNSLSHSKSSFSFRHFQTDSCTSLVSQGFLRHSFAEKSLPEPGILLSEMPNI